MKRPFVLILISLILLISCKAPADPFDPPDFTPQKPPSDWITPDYDIRHIAVTEKNVNKIPIVKIDLPEMPSSFVLPTSEGGCLAVTQVNTEEDKSKDPIYCLRAIRYTADGSASWDKQYGEVQIHGYIVSMCLFPDNGFAVSCRTTNGSPNDYDYFDIIIYFSPDGTQLWSSEAGKYVSGSFDDLFALDDGSVIAVGTVVGKMLDDGTVDNEISFIRFDKEGHLFKQMTYGIAGYDTLMDASYSRETGLAVIWRSESREGNTSGVSFQQISKIGCYTEEFTEKWVITMDKNRNLFNIQLLNNGGGILAFGTVTNDADLQGVSTMFHFDANGNNDWTFSAEKSNYWVRCASGLSDGRIAAGVMYNTDEKEQYTDLYIMSEAGKGSKIIETVPGYIQQLVKTNDGGFTAILYQYVHALPQPPEISSIWIDTEAIISHYDKDLQLVWRRVIDQYKNVTRSDIVIATGNDSLLIG